MFSNWPRKGDQDWLDVAVYRKQVLMQLQLFSTASNSNHGMKTYSCLKMDFLLQRHKGCEWKLKGHPSSLATKSQPCYRECIYRVSVHGWKEPFLSHSIYIHYLLFSDWPGETSIQLKRFVTTNTSYEDKSTCTFHSIGTKEQKSAGSCPHQSVRSAAVMIYNAFFLYQWAWALQLGSHNKVHVHTIKKVHIMYHDDASNILSREIHGPNLFAIPSSWEIQANVDLKWNMTDLIAKTE